MIRTKLQGTDAWHLFRLIPFCYGATRMGFIYQNYHSCDDSISAYDILFTAWITVLAFVHFNWPIQSWFQMTLEIIRVNVVTAFVIWGAIAYGTISCGGVIQEISLELIAIGKRQGLRPLQP